MKLGLAFDEVRIEDYNSEWENEFFRIRDQLTNISRIEEYRIEHIGSTSIKGMKAKPIIDILVGVDDIESVDNSLIEKLSKIGFLRLKVQRNGEIVFAKFTDNTYKVKTHFIHMVNYRGELWEKLIFFRDYLRKSEESRKKYLQIKLDYISKSSTGVNEYTDYKESFVNSIISKIGHN